MSDNEFLDKHFKLPQSKDDERAISPFNIAAQYCSDDMSAERYKKLSQLTDALNAITEQKHYLESQLPLMTPERIDDTLFSKKFKSHLIHNILWEGRSILFRNISDLKTFFNYINDPQLREHIAEIITLYIEQQRLYFLIQRDYGRSSIKMKRIFNFSNQQQNAIRHKAHKFYRKTNRLLHKNNPIPKHIHSLPLCDGPYYLTKHNTEETNFSEGVVSLNDAVRSLVHLLQKRFHFDCFLNTVTPNSQYCILFNDLNYHININFQSNELDGNSAGLCWEYAFHSEIDVSKDPFIPKDKLNSNEFSILFHEAGHAIDQLCCLYDLTRSQTQAVKQCVDIFESNDIREKIDDISNSIEVPSHLFEFLSIEQSVIDFIQPCSTFLENIKERLLLLCLSHSLFSLKMHKMVQGHNITDIPHKTYYYYSIKLFFHQLIIFHSEVREYRMSDYYFWGA